MNGGLSGSGLPSRCHPALTDEEPISPVLLTPAPPQCSPPRVETSTALGFGGECGHYGSLFGACGASGGGIDSAIRGGL